MASACSRIALPLIGSRVLNGYGIHTDFEVCDGDHTNRIVERMEKAVLPFFSRNLAFPAVR